MAVELLNTGLITLPSIDLTGGNANDVSSGVVKTESFSGFTNQKTVKKGDLSITFNETIGNKTLRQGGPEMALTFCPQSFEFSLDFNRKSLYGFGNHFAQGRKLNKPILGSLSVDMINTEFEEGKLSGIVGTLGTLDIFSVTINYTNEDSEQSTITIGSPTNRIPFSVENISYNHSINDNLTTRIDLAFSV